MEIDFSQYLPNDKKTIIAAIEKSNPEVISSQIVAQTKLPVHTVEILLSQIASETHGHILVTSDGNLIYKFKPDLKKEYINVKRCTLMIETGAEILEGIILKEKHK